MLRLPSPECDAVDLILFEAAVRVLILSGGRMTQLGLGCAIAFHLALCGWGGT
jgi:hypothetical protein